MPSEPSNLAPQRLGGYELRRVIGRGAAGTVWEAWDPKLDRRAAIKVVRLAGKSDQEREELHARFRQEAQLTARLQHQGVVGVFGYDETEDDAYLVMEFVDGETLHGLLDRGEKLALDQIVTVMASALTTLDHCHRRGVVHRDIKPSNLMLTSEGETKVADFGVARPEASEMTIAGTLIGTLPYMSPEQYTAKHPVDARSDIWSCGVVLYELLTGRRPFRGDMTAVMQQVLNVTPSPPSTVAPGVPPAFDAIVARAMAKEPDARYASAAAFAAALRAVATVPPAPEPEVAAPARRGRALPVLGGGLALALVVAAALFWWFDGVPTQGMMALWDRMMGGTPARTEVAIQRPEPTPPPSPTPVVVPPAPPLPEPAPAPAPLPAPLPTFVEQLLTTLAATVPNLPVAEREARVRAYEQARGAKAMAVLPGRGTWFADGHNNQERAEIASLEGCQVFYGQPCALVASGDELVPRAGADRRDMPRVRYAAGFEPAQVPAVFDAVRSRADIAGYRGQSGPKAAALHPSGLAVVATGEESQRAAEVKALEACNSDPSRARRAGQCFLYAIGDDVVLTRRFTEAQTAAPPSFNEQLLGALAALLPNVATAEREAYARTYGQARAAKALAVQTSRGIWQADGLTDQDGAESVTLERCQIFYGQPCAMVATGATMAAQAGLDRRDMPRVRHAAGFDPSQIPAIVGTLRNRADIVGYRRQTGPKAVALHPWGTIFVTTTEENQRAAEVKALEACSGDPSRGRRGGPCFLYAIGDDVVLGRRFTEAQTAALPTFNEQLVTALTALLPNGSAAAREALARDYEQARTAKALAVLAGRGTWYLEGRANADEAETATLEGCQIFYGQPCALVASGDGVVPRVGTENWPARDMPRVRHAPGFDPAQIPAVTGAARGRADIVGYRGHAGPKAMALHPWGRVFVAAGEENQRAAEAKALEVCNGDPSRAGRGGTCYLYAIGDEVVMARRLTEPQTPAPVVIPVVTPPPPQLGPRELSRAEIVELQKRLQEMGFAPGAADGEVRLSLLEALDAFALAAQMPTATELKLPTLERARLPLSAASRVEALVGLARKALDAQDVGRALRLLGQAPQIASPPSFQVLLMTGEAHAQRGDTAAARIAFEAARKAAGNAREQAQVEGMLGRLVPDVFPPALPGPLGVLAKPGQPGWSVDGRTGCRVWNPDPVASQTMTWTGPCRNANNIAEGEGHLQWRNPAGVTGYRGALSNGVRHGQGLIEFADGNRFESRFNNGRPDGPGTITLRDKTVMKVTSRDGCVREGKSLLMNIGRSREACVAQ